MHKPNNGPTRNPDSFIDRLRRENTRSDGDEGAAWVVSPEQAEQTVEATVDETADEKAAHTANGTIDETAGPAADATEDPTADKAGHDHVEKPARRLPPEARRVLVSLMRQGVVLAARKAKVFEALVRHEDAIRAHLAELYLQLVLDERAGVAFIQSRSSDVLEGDDDASVDADALAEELDDSAEGATLIARRTISLYDTLLLLILRKHYQERESAGEQRIVIDIERVESALVPFLPLTASERSDRRQLNSAITRLVEKRLLSRVRGDDERFEITPVIRYVVDAAFLDTLLAEYVRLAGGSNDGSSDETSGEPSAGSGDRTSGEPSVESSVQSSLLLPEPNSDEALP